MWAEDSQVRSTFRVKFHTKKFVERIVLHTPQKYDRTWNIKFSVTVTRVASIHDERRDSSKSDFVQKDRMMREHFGV